MTNVASNMVTVTVVCAVAIPLCMASGGAVSTPAIAMIIGMLASYAFVTPPAHPNVPLAIGSGWTKTGQVILYGTILMVISIVVTVVSRLPHCQRSYGRIILTEALSWTNYTLFARRLTCWTASSWSCSSSVWSWFVKLPSSNSASISPSYRAAGNQEVLRHARSLLHNPAYTDSLTDFMVHLMALVGLNRLGIKTHSA